MSLRDRRIGILGGTFDPIHIGHLIIASCAADALGLETVQLMPAQTPPHKRGMTVSNVEHRVAMVKLAIEDDSRFSFSALDLRMDAPSYTAELVERIGAAHPESELFFIAGADSLRDFPFWHAPQRILAHARLAIAARPGIEISGTVLDAVPRLRERTSLFESPLMEISATAIRRRVQIGHSIRYLVPDSVETYIRRHGLYVE
jgi:nicotinate-nucleotide adenylyltransferase